MCLLLITSALSDKSPSAPGNFLSEVEDKNGPPMIDQELSGQELSPTRQISALIQDTNA
jgi:hypothetical protein